MSDAADISSSDQHWLQLLKEKQLAGRGEELLRDYLRTLFPPFDAPTDAATWKRQASTLRQHALERIYLRGIPKDLVEEKVRVVWGDTHHPDESYSIHKLRYEIYPDYWVPALLYEPTKLHQPAPVMLNPNGHHWGGKAVDYKQARCVNLVRRGIIALNMEFIGMGELQADVHHDNIAHLNLTGLSGVGLFYLALKKALDVALAHPYADRSRVGITGLSGGGWQSIVLAALDERITLAVPVSGYSTMRGRVEVIDDIGDLEQAPPDMATVLDYSHMTAMCAPRPFLSVLNEYDEIFRTDRTRPLIYDDVLPTYSAFNASDNFEFYSSHDPGTHCYEKDIRCRLYEFLNKHWKIAGPLDDIHRDDETLPETSLNVGLPNEQTHLLEIALKRARELSQTRSAVRTSDEREALRKKLSEMLRLPSYPLPAAEQVQPSLGTRNEILRVGPFQIPLSRRIESNDRSATIVIEDAGRAGHNPAEKPCLTCLVPYPRNVFIADILGTGESRANERRLMLLETAGQRLLGIQVAQIQACATYAGHLSGVSRVQLAAVGPGASLACLLAAGLQPQMYESLNVMLEFTSLRRLIDWGEKWERFPAMFCYGLLEVCDIPDLRMLLEDVRYIQNFRHVR